MLFSRTAEVFCGNDGENTSTVCNAELSNVACRGIFLLYGVAFVPE